MELKEVKKSSKIVKVVKITFLDGLLSWIIIWIFLKLGEYAGPDNEGHTPRVTCNRNYWLN